MLGFLARDRLQAATGRSYPFLDWWIRFVTNNPVVGGTIALVLSVCIGLLGVHVANTPLRKFGWGIGWFLLAAMFFFVGPMAAGHDYWLN